MKIHKKFIILLFFLLTLPHCASKKNKNVIVTEVAYDKATFNPFKYQPDNFEIPQQSESTEVSDLPAPEPFDKNTEKTISTEESFDVIDTSSPKYSFEKSSNQIFYNSLSCNYEMKPGDTVANVLRSLGRSNLFHDGSFIRTLKYNMNIKNFNNIEPGSYIKIHPKEFQSNHAWAVKNCF